MTYRRSAQMDPNGGEHALDDVAGVLDLVKPFGLSDKVTLAAGAAASAFVTSRLGKGREGALIGFSFDFGTEDYVQSPVTVQLVTRDQAGSVQGVAKGEMLLGPFRTQVGSLTTPVILPFPVPIPVDREVALVVTNGAGQPFDASGLLIGITWSHEQARDVRRAVWGARMRDLWPEALFGGKGGK